MLEHSREELRFVYLRANVLRRKTGEPKETGKPRGLRRQKRKCLDGNVFCRIGRQPLVGPVHAEEVTMSGDAGQY